MARVSFLASVTLLLSGLSRRLSRTEPTDAPGETPDEDRILHDVICLTPCQKPPTRACPASKTAKAFGKVVLRHFLRPPTVRTRPDSVPVHGLPPPTVRPRPRSAPPTVPPRPRSSPPTICPAHSPTPPTIRPAHSPTPPTIRPAHSPTPPTSVRVEASASPTPRRSLLVRVLLRLMGRKTGQFILLKM
ncbi:extensin-like [Penaeus chinensis]|uniref:extensin-like n=1 Tax=Penaeus chinensis TaxID=139456 RepID=UPI001FB75F82|nr:extensin-like [Penaeus chinensis]